MNHYQVDLGNIPVHFRGIVQTWYVWQEINLRKMNRAPSQESGDPGNYWFWQDVTPIFDGQCLKLFYGGNDYVQTVTPRDEGFILGVENRNRPSHPIFLRLISDVQKYLLLGTADGIRMSLGLPRLDVPWYQAGLAQRVRMRNLDADLQYSQRYELAVEGEESSRGWMDEIDAVTFSHALEMSYEELDSLLREGIPSDWFTVTFS